MAWNVLEHLLVLCTISVSRYNHDFVISYIIYTLGSSSVTVLRSSFASCNYRKRLDTEIRRIVRAERGLGIAWRYLTGERSNDVRVLATDIASYQSKRINRQLEFVAKVRSWHCWLPRGELAGWLAGLVDCRSRQRTKLNGRLKKVSERVRVTAY